MAQSTLSIDDADYDAEQLFWEAPRPLPSTGRRCGTFSDGNRASQVAKRDA
jgi:hypothetical protein